MSYCDKLDLENYIFARAYELGADVHARYGGFSSACNDELLQALLWVYNRHFRQENWQQFGPGSDGLELYRAYHAQCAHRPGLTPLYSLKDFNFELIMWRNYENSQI